MDWLWILGGTTCVLYGVFELAQLGGRAAPPPLHAFDADTGRPIPLFLERRRRDRRRTAGRRGGDALHRDGLRTDFVA